MAKTFVTTWTFPSERCIQKDPHDTHVWQEGDAPVLDHRKAKLCLGIKMGRPTVKTEQAEQKVSN
jgi:hypothetical protein